MTTARRQTAVACLAVALLVVAIGAAAVGVGPPTATRSPESGADDAVDRLHRAGVTGENVTVGVVDPTGFDRSHPRLAGRVAAARTFGDGSDPAAAGARSHGTASAALVARVAPDATLLLATADSPEAYRDAVRWLLERDVDVILAPASFLGRGESVAPAASTRATRQGVVFVAATGNLAAGHWEGAFAPATDGEGTVRHRFAPRAVGGNASRLRLRGDARERVVWLSWEGEGPFTASLYRVQNGETTLVARSTPVDGDGVTNQRLVADGPAGRYYLVVRGPADAAGTHLELQSPTHEFVRPTPRGSVAPPATRPGVLSVGAVDPRTGTVEPFSGRGPTADGRLGVDVVAPDRQAVGGVDGPFVGTSAAAAYTAGVVALLLDVDPSLSPRAVEVRLEETATPVGPAGPDPTAGYGRVAPWAAVNVSAPPEG